MNTKFLKTIFFCVVGFILILSANVNAEGKQKNKLSKTQGLPNRTYLNINNLSTQIYNNGNSDIDPSGNSGLIYPKGSNKGAVFQSGLVWGAKIGNDPQPRVGGSTYSQGLQAGKIISPGVAEDPDLDKNRIYRVRPDIIPSGGPRPANYNAGSVASEVADHEGDESAVIAQYELDWMEWPATDGAPFKDMNANGIYEPSVDIPGVPGADQTIWFVANDLDPTLTQNLYGATPIGIEMQATMWAYAQQGALGNMFFRKYKLINKSTTNFDSMYVSMWSDVDLGNSIDDYSGCDTSLSLGYTYNASATDATYSPLPPPAVGFDFFQGPIVQGAETDEAIFDGKVVKGRKNLPMTAFYYFARGDANVTDPTLEDLAGSTQFYNFMQGKIGLTGNYFVNPLTNQPTTFVLTGDPQTRTGWIDGQVLPAGDRRMGLSSGPFQMVPGDTQEVVVAEIVAGSLPGMDRLSAVGLLKFYDQQAQSAYDNFFDLPVAPQVPLVNVAELDKEIVLDWGENNAIVNQTETANSKGYTFQGYNVYQLPSASASKESGVRIATYDIVDGISKIEEREFDSKTGVVAVRVQQFGNDTGIRRYLDITTDALQGGTPLVNGNRYYFAVTSYSYNPDAVPNNLENPLAIFTAVPQSENPGVRYGSSFGDTVDVAHVAGVSDGNVYPVVVDPTQLTGKKYTVSFKDVNGTILWKVVRDDGVTVLDDQSNQNADDASPTVDGLQFRVIGAPLSFKKFTVVSNANGPLDPPEIGCFAFNGNGFPLLGESDRPSDRQQAGGGHWGVATGEVGSAFSYEYFLGRVTQAGARWPLIIPNDFEIRFTAQGGIGFEPAAFTTGADAGGTVINVPFELWNIGSATPNDPSDDIRYFPYLIDTDADKVFNLSSVDHTLSGGANDPETDWFYWVIPKDKTPGQAGYNAIATSIQGNPDGHVYLDENLMDGDALRRMVLVNWNGGTYPGPFNQDMPEAGTVFRIESTKPNAAGVDVFEFTAPQPKFTVEDAKVDINKMNVYPNPYYGVNSEELNKYNRFVTFTHLSNNAIIRIFNLAGVLVRTINKNDNSQFQRWDLANDNGLPVASGLYIAYIDMPEIGETKILKVAIIQEQQILDRF